MEKWIPYGKLSKMKKHKSEFTRRPWGTGTRLPERPKAARPATEKGRGPGRKSFRSCVLFFAVRR